MLGVGELSANGIGDTRDEHRINIPVDNTSCVVLGTANHDTTTKSG
jgi:hypothetical protein